MNKEELKTDILYDIEMQLYMEFNDKIATMNDYLGEIYSYKDIEDVEQAEQLRKIVLMEYAIRDLQQKVNQLEEDYKNEVEENLKLSELWRKSQEEKRQLETNRDEALKRNEQVLKMIVDGRSREQFLPYLKNQKIILERGKEC